MAFTPLPPKEHQHDYSVETETRLLLPSGEILGPGDVEMNHGVGTTYRKSDAGALVIDAPAVDKDAPAGIYVPDLSTWPATTLALPGGESYLTMLEALIAGTTPAAGTDGANYHAIRAAGTISGHQDVPLSAEAQREFRYNGAAESMMATQEKKAAEPHFGVGAVDKVTPTADINSVTAVECAGGLNSGGFDTKPRRFIIMDAAFNYLAVTDWHNDDWPQANPPTVRQYNLLQSIDLAQDVTYYVGWELQNWDIPTSDDVGISGASDLGAYSGPVLDPGSKAGWQVNPGATSWADRTQTDWNGGTWTASGFDCIYWALYGKPGGVLLTGDIQLSVVTVGAPPNFPTQVNTRLQWASNV